MSEKIDAVLSFWHKVYLLYMAMDAGNLHGDLFVGLLWQSEGGVGGNVWKLVVDWFF